LAAAHSVGADAPNQEGIVMKKIAIAMLLLCFVAVNFGCKNDKDQDTNSSGSMSH